MFNISSIRKFSSRTCDSSQVRMLVIGLGASLVTGACKHNETSIVTRWQVAKDYAGTGSCALGGQNNVSTDDLGLASPWVKEIKSSKADASPHPANEDLRELGIGSGKGDFLADSLPTQPSRVIPSTAPAALAPSDAQSALPIIGHPGYVWSPFAGPNKPVDVRKFAPGSEALCPYTMKTFTVPARTASLDSVPEARPPKREPVVEPLSMAEATESDPLARRTENSSSPGPAPSGQTISREAAQSLPTGTWVKGKPGFVFSPYARQFELVDVEGMKPGSVVKCPYTGKFFIIPKTSSEKPGAEISNPDGTIYRT